MVRSKTELRLEEVGCAEEVADVGEDEMGSIEDTGDAAAGAELGHVELAAEAALELLEVFLASSVFPMKPPARPAMSIKMIP
jgi:hypothetical protein